MFGVGAAAPLGDGFTLYVSEGPTTLSLLGHSPVSHPSPLPSRSLLVPNWKGMEVAMGMEEGETA